MVTVNVDIHNMLKGQVGEVSGFKIMRSIVKVSGSFNREECCLTILHNNIVLYHYKNAMQLDQYVKV